MKRFVYHSATVVLLALIAGCSSSSREGMVEVAGAVTLDGEPIPNGTITFLSADGTTPAGGGKIQDGSYRATVPPGEKIILVLGNRVVGQEPVYEGVADSPMRDKIETITPGAYNAKQATPLKATIEDAQEDLDFDLSSSFDG